MLRIVDKSNRTLFILGDEDEEPVPIDELIIRNSNIENKKKGKKENLDANSVSQSEP